LVGGDSIDPFIMEMPDGMYMYWVVPRRPIRVQKLSADGTELVGNRRSVLLPNPDRPYEKLIEAPWVVQHGDYYYMFYSGNHCCGPKAHYALMVARSRYPRQGFRKLDTPVLRSNASFRAPGHNAVATDDAGHEWAVYHAIERGNQSYQRFLMIDRIRWLNGWPRINGGRGPSSGEKPAPDVALSL
jgi:arabinan endo-1,5-alpha-L-arabinosidase